MPFACIGSPDAQEAIQAEERSISKSAVSRRFVALSQKQMTAWLTKPLHDVDLRVLVIDGIVFRDHTILIVLGIDSDGRKHVLGLREGTTENMVRHSGAKEGRVSLTGQEMTIKLDLSDTGRGFDIDSVKTKGGFRRGVISMKERVRHVGGTLSIESHASSMVRHSGAKEPGSRSASLSRTPRGVVRPSTTPHAALSLSPLRLLVYLEEDIGSDHDVLAAGSVVGRGSVDAGSVERPARDRAVGD